MDARPRLIDRFGQTTIERGLGVIGFLAVTAAMIVSALELPRWQFLTAGGVAGAAIVLWNILVLLRLRGDGRSRRPSPW